MAETGWALLAEMAAEIGVPPRMMLGPGMAGLADVDLRPMSLPDQAIMRATFIEALGRTTREFDGGLTAPDPRAVDLALRMSRQRVLSLDSGLSSAGRDFVAAHCPCG